MITNFDFNIEPWLKHFFCKKLTTPLIKTFGFYAYMQYEFLCDYLRDLLLIDIRFAKKFCPPLYTEFLSRAITH